MHAVKLIGQPLFDWPTFLSLAHQATGDRLAEEADASARPFTNVERIVSTLHRMTTEKTKYEIETHLLAHVSLTFLIATDQDRTLNELSGISTLIRYTNSPAVLVVATAPFSTWEQRVRSNKSELWSDVGNELRTVLPTVVKRLT